MRRLSRKLLKILDGSPGALGGYQRGQSLVELVLITPLLIIMVAGIIEIGWYANHVLILLEVSRVGARQATLFTGENGYQSWPNQASIHPIAYVLNKGFNTTKPAPGDLGNFSGLDAGAQFVDPVVQPSAPPEALNYRKCPIPSASQGFYNLVVCSMIDALDPLWIKGRAPDSTDMLARRHRVAYNQSGYQGMLVGREVPGGGLTYTYGYNEMFLYPDDIVVSVFALQAINNATATQKDKILTPPPPVPTAITGLNTPTPEPVGPPTVDANLYGRTYDFGDRFPRGYQVIVVGRYPTNANECNVTFTPNGATAFNINGQLAVDKLAAGESYINRIFTLGAADLDYQQRAWDSPARNSITAPKPVAGTFTYQRYSDADKTTWGFRDPFEFYGPYGIQRDGDGKGRFYELIGYDDKPEIQRGFVWTGQHVIDTQLNLNTGKQLFCIGSSWSDERVQDLMNSPSFLKLGVVMPPDGDPAKADAAWSAAYGPQYDEWQARAKFLPSQGAVLVEMFWRHDILLDFPLMTPIIRLMQGAGGPYNIVISAWAMFPLPSAEPNLNFGFPPAS